MSKKQVIKINESQLRQIVTESVKRVLNEGIGDEYLDNFGKSVSRSKRFGNVKDLSSWSGEQFDSLNSTRKDMHKKGRGVKTKGSTETRDWLRRQTEKGNPIIKYKKNPDEWTKKHLDSVDESKIKKAIKESVKRVLKEWEEPDYAANGKYYVAADSNSDYFDDYDEAYNYALKLANNERKRFPDNWEEIHLMDNEEWQSIVIFNETGIHDLENGTFIPWGD